MSNPVSNRLSKAVKFGTPPAVAAGIAVVKDPTLLLGPVVSTVAKNPKKATEFVAGGTIVGQFARMGADLASKTCQK